MERYEIVVDDEGNYCGLIPSENGSVVKYADAQATVEALQRERDEWRSNAVAQIASIKIWQQAIQPRPPMTDDGWTANTYAKEFGFYWLKWDWREPQIVQVRGASVHFTSGLTMSLEEVNGQFLGPITPTDRETWRSAGRVEGLRDGLVKIQERVDFYVEQEQQSQGPMRAGRGLQRNEASGCAEELARLIEQAAQEGTSE